MSEAENLARAEASGEIRRFVEAQRGHWDHATWLTLLDRIARTYGPVVPEHLGLKLEEEKRRYAPDQTDRCPVCSERFTYRHPSVVTGPWDEKYCPRCSPRTSDERIRFPREDRLLDELPAPPIEPLRLPRDRPRDRDRHCSKCGGRMVHASAYHRGMDAPPNFWTCPACRDQAKHLNQMMGYAQADRDRHLRQFVIGLGVTLLAGALAAFYHPSFVVVAIPALVWAGYEYRRSQAAKTEADGYQQQLPR